MLVPEEHFSQKISRLAEKIGKTKLPKNAKKSDTTIVALKYRTENGSEAVAIAADRYTTCGSTIVDDKTKKIGPITDYSAIGFSGLVSTIVQTYITYKQLVYELFSNGDGYSSIRAQANLLTNLFQSMAVYEDFCAYAIFAGVDPKTKKALLIDIDISGLSSGDKPFGATGSGGDDALQYLENYFEEHPDEKGKNTEEKTVELLLKALKKGARSAFSSHPRIATPCVTLITDYGYKELDEKIVAEKVRRLQL